MTPRINIAALIIVLFVFSSCSEQTQEPEKILRPVKFERVSPSNNHKTRSFSGTSESDKAIELSFRGSGIISYFNVLLGQRVRKGQLLAKLENVQARLAYEQALAAQSSAESQLNTAKLSLDRARNLFEKGSASLSDFEAAKNTYRTAQQQYESTKRGVSIQQEQIRYGYLYAPEAGVIAAVHVEANENVNPGQPIATLNAGTKMQINLGVPESVINAMKQGDTVTVNFVALPGQAFKAKLSEIAPSPSLGTAIFPVKATLLAASPEVKSGMSAKVQFDFKRKEMAEELITVPAHAVGEDPKGRFVFLIQEEAQQHIVKRQAVVIGDLTSEGFEIVSGLSAGQRIATAGLQSLWDGQEVKVNP